MVQMNIKVVKALASATRLDILHALKYKHGITLSDLARKLGKHVTTIKEHLDILQTAGLVEREKEEGHKFVFYSLSKSGNQVMVPYIDEVTILFMISFLVLGQLFSMTMFTGTYSMQQESMLMEPSMSKSRVLSDATIPQEIAKTSTRKTSSDKIERENIVEDKDVDGESNQGLPLAAIAEEKIASDLEMDDSFAADSIGPVDEASEESIAKRGSEDYGGAPPGSATKEVVEVEESLAPESPQGEWTTIPKSAQGPTCGTKQMTADDVKVLFWFCMWVMLLSLGLVRFIKKRTIARNIHAETQWEETLVEISGEKQE